MKKILCITAIIILSLPSQLSAENYCGELDNRGNGPFDYYNPDRKKRLKDVEDYHFSKNVENLISGDSTQYIGGDITYTLRVFPNHPRALAAMSRLVIREKTHKAAGASYSALCFFDRAVRFRPKDAMVRSLFGGHLLKTGKTDLALEQLIIASELEPNNPTFNYNLGLLYFDKRDYSRARKYAEKAYSQEFPLPGLRNKLQNAGKW